MISQVVLIQNEPILETRRECHVNERLKNARKWVIGAKTYD